MFLQIPKIYYLIYGSVYFFMSLRDIWTTQVFINSKCRLTVLFHFAFEIHFSQIRQCPFTVGHSIHTSTLDPVSYIFPLFRFLFQRANGKSYHTENKCQFHIPKTMKSATLKNLWFLTHSVRQNLSEATKNKSFYLMSVNAV